MQDSECADEMQKSLINLIFLEKVNESVIIKSGIYSQKRDDKIREVTWMAKPIEIGLVLEGDDAKRFQTYMENPTITEKGRGLIREAMRLAKSHPIE